MRKTVSEALPSRQYAKRGPVAEFWHHLKRNKGAVIGMFIIVIFILITIFSAIFISYEQVTAMSATNSLAPPSWEHPFGTDDMGRDLLMRALYGTRYSLSVGFGAIAFSLIIGTFLGSVAGYMGGWLEEIIMRVSDVLASIPGLLLGMVIVTVLGPTLINLIFAIGVTTIPPFVRISRASILTVKGNEFTEAARAIGMSSFRIIFTQVLPNGLSPIIVITTSIIGTAILQAASLSFLGFGIPVPTPEWGSMVSSGRNFLWTAPHIALFPGLFIMGIVLACNLFGDGLRDALDPKLKR